METPLPDRKPYQSLNVRFRDEQGDLYAAVILNLKDDTVTLKAFGEHGYDRVVRDIPYSRERLHRAPHWFFVDDDLVDRSTKEQE